MESLTKEIKRYSIQYSKNRAYERNKYRKELEKEKNKIEEILVKNEEDI